MKPFGVQPNSYYSCCVVVLVSWENDLICRYFQWEEIHNMAFAAYLSDQDKFLFVCRASGQLHVDCLNLIFWYLTTWWLVYLLVRCLQRKESNEIYGDQENGCVMTCMPAYTCKARLTLESRDLGWRWDWESSHTVQRSEDLEKLRGWLAFPLPFCSTEASVDGMMPGCIGEGRSSANSLLN